MAMIDNTLAAQIPTFDPATPLAEAAKVQNMQAEAQAAQFKQRQTEIGSEARGLQAFVNTPEFPAKWAEAADRMHDKGLLDDRAHQQWRNTPSPLLLKQMITSTEDPTLTFRKDEAVREQGNTDRSFGLQKTTSDRNYLLAKRAADRADDPTPDNFVEDKSAPGGYRPIGPADPSYLARVAAETAKAKGDVPTIIGAGSSVIVPNKAAEGPLFTNKPAGGAAIDDETADFLAKRSLQGDTRALVGLGRGAQGAENILKIQQRATAIAKDQGMDASEVLANIATQAGVTAEARTLGTKSAHFGVAEKAMEESLPIALAASKEVPRTSFPLLNQMIQSGETNVGDPKLKKFLIATDTAAKDYARTINPSGQTREGDIAYARKLISTADGPEAYEAALQQLKVEAGVTKRAIQRQKDEVKGGGKAKSESQGSGGDAMLKQAKDAILQGAPKEAVIKRLRDAGVDPGDL